MRHWQTDQGLNQHKRTKIIRTRFVQVRPTMGSGNQQGKSSIGPKDSGIYVYIYIYINLSIDLSIYESFYLTIYLFMLFIYLMCMYNIFVYTCSVNCSFGKPGSFLEGHETGHCTGCCNLHCSSLKKILLQQISSCLLMFVLENLISAFWCMLMFVSAWFLVTRFDLRQAQKLEEFILHASDAWDLNGFRYEPIL